MYSTFLLVALFVFGTVIGSFLNVIIWRLPNELSLGGRSFCPNCKKTLNPLQLVPIFSYFVLKGRCYNCRAKISIRYPIIEIITGALTVIIFYFFWPHNLQEWLIVVRNLFITYVLLVVFVIDYEHFLILDKIIYPVTVVLMIGNFIITYVTHSFNAGITSLFYGGILSALLGFIFFGAIWLLSSGKWIGFGDVKFMLFLGLALGWPSIFVALMLAFYLGAVVSIPLLIVKKKHMQSKLPFGTFLSVSGIVTLLFGHSLIYWYLQILGL